MAVRLEFVDVSVNRGPMNAQVRRYLGRLHADCREFGNAIVLAILKGPHRPSLSAV